MNVLALLLSLVAVPPVAPCLSGTPACTQWVTMGKGASRSLIYRTYPLDVKNQSITRALIMIHGAGRNADNYFRTAVAATFLANALDSTIVIAPRFSSNDRACRDTLDTNEVNWSCSGDSWRSGGGAVGNDSLTSYDLVDEILRRLARKDVFPNLKAIVLTGHSAGGQYVSRYAMANLVHDKLGVPVTYIVSNPSSYAYLDPERPAGSPVEMRSFGDARNCTTFNRWPYGLLERTGYTARLSDDQLKQQMAERPVTYLLSELDVLPIAGFDASCPAMAQGSSRLARGQAFSSYVIQKYGAHHQVTIVPLCGHNARCVYTADPALKVLFPKPTS